MSRVVRGTDGTIAFDPTGKAAGRGTYICDDPTCREPLRLAEAVQRALGPGLSLAGLDLEVTHAAT